MKKTILTIAIILCSFGFLASAKAEGFKPYLGFYLGYAEIEGTSTVVNRDVSADGTDLGGFIGLKFETQYSERMFLNASVEASYGASGVDGGTAGIDLNKDYDYGISFRPGFDYYFDERFNLSPYGIIGYRNAGFESTNTISGNSAERDYSGFELGFGANVMTYENFGFRVEYSHTFFDEDGGFEPDEDLLRFGILYTFDPL